MCAKTLPGKKTLLSLSLVATTVFLIALLPTSTKAQRLRVAGEMATCTVKMTNGKLPKSVVDKKTIGNVKGLMKDKLYRNRNRPLPSNAIGYFERVANIQPKERVPVEIAYRNGRRGEKVEIIALDGGVFDNGKKVKVVQLDNQKKLSFNFQVSNSLGIYRVALRKGADTKIVQLWVGAEHALSGK